MKDGILIVIGAIGGFISYILGGWDTALTTLVIFMVIDYISGLMVAGIFKKSGKTESGSLSSNIGWKGLCKKVGTLFIVAVSAQLDIVLNAGFIKDAAIIAFISNECISLMENAGLMGIPIPKPLLNAIDVLKNKADEQK